MGVQQSTNISTADHVYIPKFLSVGILGIRVKDNGIIITIYDAKHSNRVDISPAVCSRKIIIQTRA